MILNDDESDRCFSDAQLSMLVKSVSKKGKVSLDFDDFLALVSHMQELRLTFNAIDKDANGSIDHQELEEALRELGFKFTPDQVKLFLHMVDDDESGTIEYEEFFQLDYFIKRAQMLFTAADEDDSGELSFEEVKELLPTLDVDAKTDEEVRRVMNALDKDASGTISFEEFVNLLFCLIYGIALE